MGKIKKIIENELVGGTQNTDVYPVTSIKAVYDENNERLDSILNRRGVVNISTNYNSDHIAEVLTLEQAIAKVPTKDKTLGFVGTFLTSNGWKTYQFNGDSLTKWLDITEWFPIQTFDREYLPLIAKFIVNEGFRSINFKCKIQKGDSYIVVAYFENLLYAEKALSMSLKSGESILERIDDYVTPIGNPIYYKSNYDANEIGVYLSTDSSTDNPLHINIYKINNNDIILKSDSYFPLTAELDENNKIICYAGFNKKAPFIPQINCMFNVRMTFSRRDQITMNVCGTGDYTIVSNYFWEAGDFLNVIFDGGKYVLAPLNQSAKIFTTKIGYMSDIKLPFTLKSGKKYAIMVRVDNADNLPQADLNMSSKRDNGSLINQGDIALYNRAINQYFWYTPEEDFSLIGVYLPAYKENDIYIYIISDEKIAEQFIVNKYHAPEIFTVKKGKIKSTHLLKAGSKYRIKVQNISTDYTGKYTRLLVKGLEDNSININISGINDTIVSGIEAYKHTELCKVSYGQKFKIHIKAEGCLSNDNYLYAINFKRNGEFIKHDYFKRLVSDNITEEYVDVLVGKNVGELLCYTNLSNGNITFNIKEEIPKEEIYTIVPKEDTSLLFSSDGEIVVDITPITEKENNIIFDTDFAWDIDDLLATRILQWAHKSGQCSLMAIVVNTLVNNVTTGNEAYSSNIRGLDSFMYQEQLGYIPIGLNKEHYRLTNTSGWQTSLYDDNKAVMTEKAATQDAISLIRKCLSQVKEGEKVKYISVGHFNNMYDLLNSEPDEYSDLNGIDLIKSKISEFYIMGGEYPTGKEFNIYVYEPQNAAYFINNCPVPLYFIGGEWGRIRAGAKLNEAIGEDDYCYKAMLQFGEDNAVNGRSAWDPLTVLAALNKDLFDWVQGTNVINPETGDNNFTEGFGTHFYAKPKFADNFYKRTMDDIIHHKAWINSLIQYNSKFFF